MLLLSIPFLQILLRGKQWYSSYSSSIHLFRKRNLWVKLFSHLHNFFIFWTIKVEMAWLLQSSIVDIKLMDVDVINIFCIPKLWDLWTVDIDSYRFSSSSLCMFLYGAIDRLRFLGKRMKDFLMIHNLNNIVIIDVNDVRLL